MSWFSKRGIQVVIGLVAVVALLLSVDLEAVKIALLDVSLGDLGILLLLSVALVLVSVVKWRAFLARLGIEASISHLFRLYLVGYFVNLIMPSSLGGDVVRSLYVGKHVDRVRAVSATMLERYTGLLAMLLMASIALFFAPSVTFQIRLVTVCVVVGVFCATLLVGTGALVRLLERVRCPGSLVSRVERLQSAFRWGLSDRDLLIKAAVLSITFHLLTVVNTVAVATAVGWASPPWGDLFVVVPLILLVGAVPISPHGLGLQEGAFVFFLHSVGATTGQALAIALVLRAKSYVLALVGALGWILMPKEGGRLNEESA
jgi:uncharacterized protein (TIRG00374 family)